jgi:hypothetical protein
MNLNLSARGSFRENPAKNGREWPPQPILAAELVKLPADVAIHF